MYTNYTIFLLDESYYAINLSDVESIEDYQPIKANRTIHNQEFEHFDLQKMMNKQRKNVCYTQSLFLKTSKKYINVTKTIGTVSIKNNELQSFTYSPQVDCFFQFENKVIFVLVR